MMNELKRAASAFFLCGLIVGREAMQPLDPFLASISDDPSDLACKLVYADWLEERGDSRAEYLRSLVALDTSPVDEDKFPDFAARLREMSGRLDPHWVAMVNRGRLGTCGLYVVVPDRPPLPRRKNPVGVGDLLAPEDPRNEAYPCRYLRFCDDGRVYGMFSFYDPVTTWRDRYGETVAGSYTLEGPDLKFTISPYSWCSQNYEGTLRNGTLLVTCRFHGPDVNEGFDEAVERHYRCTYRFVKLALTAAEQAQRLAQELTDAIRCLREERGSTSPAERAAAVRVLRTRRQQTGEALAGLFCAARDPDAVVRLEAVKTLSSVASADPSAVAAVVAALGDESRFVRKVASERLLRLARAVTRPGIEAVLRDGDRKARAAARWVLEHLDRLPQKTTGDIPDSSLNQSREQTGHATDGPSSSEPPPA